MATEASRDLIRRLEHLRSLLATRNIAAYVIPYCDAHQSEYIGPADERLAFISGFTGSAGTAMVTANAALLWTDGRYFAQAERQLPAQWTLMRERTVGVPRVSDWLQQTLDSTTDAVGIDSRPSTDFSRAGEGVDFRPTAPAVRD